MTIKTKYIIIGVLMAFLTIFFFGWRIGHKRADNASQTIQNALHDEIRRYVIEIDKKILYIAEKDQEIKTLRQAKHAGDLTNEELRKLNVKYVHELTRLKLVIDTLLLDFPHNGQVVIIHDTVTVNKDKKAILLPFTFSKRDQWIALAGTFNTEAKLDINLRINADLDIWAVQKKKKDQPVVMVTSDNPYLNVISVKSIKLDVPRDKKFGIGLQMGYGIGFNAKSPTPYVGVGLQYSIIKF